MDSAAMGEEDPQSEVSVFEEYVKIQNLFEGKEWDRFMTYLRRPLPITFRVNRSLHDPQIVKTCLDEFQPLLSPEDPSEVKAIYTFCVGQQRQHHTTTALLSHNDTDSLLLSLHVLSWWRASSGCRRLSASNGATRISSASLGTSCSARVPAPTSPPSATGSASGARSRPAPTPELAL